MYEIHALPFYELPIPAVIVLFQSYIEWLKQVLGSANSSCDILRFSRLTGLPHLRMVQGESEALHLASDVTVTEVDTFSGDTNYVNHD